MIEYRRARPADVASVTRLALRALRKCTTQVVDEHKVIEMVTFFATHHEHFQCAAFEDEEAVAGVAMYVTEMPFFERGEGTIAFCYSERPQAGVTILRRLMNWVNNDMRVRRVSWGMNEGFDHRIMNLAGRLGFRSVFPTLLFEKG